MAKADTPRKKPGPKPKPRATTRKGTKGGSKVDPERLQIVEQMMGAGCSRRDIVLHVVKTYSVTEKTAYSYYLKVEKEWVNEGRNSRSYYRAKILKKLELAQKGAYTDKSWHAFITAVMAEAKIRDVIGPDEVVVHTPDAHPTENMTSAQLRAYIAEKRQAREKLLAKVVAEPASVH